MWPKIKFSQPCSIMWQVSPLNEIRYLYELHCFEWLLIRYIGVRVPHDIGNKGTRYDSG